MAYYLPKPHHFLLGHFIDFTSLMNTSVTLKDSGISVPWLLHDRICSTQGKSLSMSLNGRLLLLAFWFT